MKAESGEAIPTGEVNGVEKEEKKKKKEKKKEGEKTKPKLSETKTLAGGVKVADHIVGKGSAAKAGDRVSVRYIGKLQNGKVFDSNTKGKPVRAMASQLFASVVNLYAAVLLQARGG